MTHLLGQHKIALVMPLYGPGSLHPLAALAMWPAFCRGSRYQVEPIVRTSSLLAKGFNQCYLEVLEKRFTSGYTHMAMVHGDVCPQPGFLSLMHAECCRLDADLLSVVVPIKDGKALTSTAIGDPANPWRPIRRLTMREVFRLSETFSIEDCIREGLAEEGNQLLVNTGCFIMNVRRDWCTAVDAEGFLRVFFTVRDRVAWDAGHGRVDVAPEDWNFSRMLAAEGGRIFATRKIRLGHAGEQIYPNDQPWGDWETDEEA